MKKIDVQVKVEDGAKVKGEGDGLPHGGQGLAEIQKVNWDPRAGSPPLIVVGAFLTD